MILLEIMKLLLQLLFLTREILISGLREFLAKGQISMPVTGLAKFKTFIQMFAIAFFLLEKVEIKLLIFKIIMLIL